MQKHSCDYIYSSGGYGEHFCINGRVHPEMCKGCPLSHETRWLKLLKSDPKCDKCGSNEDVIWWGLFCGYWCLHCERVVKHDPYTYLNKLITEFNDFNSHRNRKLSREEKEVAEFYKSLRKP